MFNRWLIQNADGLKQEQEREDPNGNLLFLGLLVAPNAIALSCRIGYAKNVATTLVERL